MAVLVLPAPPLEASASLDSADTPSCTVIVSPVCYYKKLFCPVATGSAAIRRTVQPLHQGVFASNSPPGRYPFNFGDHLMLGVIGTSFTVEYGLKGAYENTVGRFTEWVGGHEATDEDRYAARVAREYGVFVQDRPFYEFPFFPAFRGLWTETKLLGPHVLRKWEGKAWLSLDYGIEGAYCRLIELASHATYGVEEDVTYALIENAPEAVLSGIPGLRKVKSVGIDSFIVKMPRYQKFTDSAQQLLRAKARFVEIAGNRQIMVTAVVPRDWSFQLSAGELLFSTEILTNRLSKRVVLRMPVSGLGVITGGLTVEHIYDY